MAAESDDDFFGGDDSDSAGDCGNELWGARADMRKAIAAAATTAYREASAGASDDAMQQAFEEGFDQARPGEFARGWVVGSLRAAALLLRSRAAGSAGTTSGASDTASEMLSVADDAETMALAAVDVEGREGRADAAAVAALNAVVRAHDRSSGEAGEAARGDSTEGRVRNIGRRAGMLLADAQSVAEADGAGGATEHASLAKLDASACAVLARAVRLLGGKGVLREGPVAAAVGALQTACEAEAAE